MTRDVNHPYWDAGDLVVIGTFAALGKAASLLVALAGGGMNPVSLVAKNVIATAMLVVLVHRVPKFGVLTLYVLITGLTSALLMGAGLMTLPGFLAAGVICDGLIRLCGGYRRSWAILAGVGAFELLARLISLGIGYLGAREDIRFFIMAAVIVMLGYLGCLIGLGAGLRFVKELRHAGIIRS
jgi:energy-coupling factor transport system substrate-specific component